MRKKTWKTRDILITDHDDSKLGEDEKMIRLLAIQAPGED